MNYLDNCGMINIWIKLNFLNDFNEHLDLIENNNIFDHKIGMDSFLLATKKIVLSLNESVNVIIFKSFKWFNQFSHK